MLVAAISHSDEAIVITKACCGKFWFLWEHFSFQPFINCVNIIFFIKWVSSICKIRGWLEKILHSYRDGTTTRLFSVSRISWKNLLQFFSLIITLGLAFVWNVQDEWFPKNEWKRISSQISHERQITRRDAGYYIILYLLFHATEQLEQKGR